MIDGVGPDYFLLLLANDKNELMAFGLLSTSPAIQKAPLYMDEKREKVKIAGADGVVLKGLVSGRTGLNEYLGSWSQVPRATRTNSDIHVADIGDEEWRVIVQRPGKARFEIAMAIATDTDRAIFNEIVKTLTPPD